MRPAEHVAALNGQFVLGAGVKVVQLVDVVVNGVHCRAAVHLARFQNKLIPSVRIRRSLTPNRLCSFFQPSFHRRLLLPN